MGTKLYVGNLSFRASEDALRDYFGAAGQVASVKIITDRDTGQSRGFGFVEMSSAEEAGKAVSMFDGKPWLDRELRVSEAKEQQPRRTGGGGGGGGERRGGERRGGGGGGGGWR